MKKSLLSTLAIAASTLSLGACTDIPPCSSSMSLDCNVGAYSEERTYRDATDKTTNFNKKPAAVMEAAPAPEPAPMPAVETTTEPIPEPMDTQIMEKADEKPLAKGLK